MPALPRLLLAVLPLLVPLAPSGAQRSPQPSDTIDARLDRMFADVTGDSIPGCVVGIERSAGRRIVRSFGMADLERTTPNDSLTVFEAGSVSKQFTAAAVLILAQRGRLSLDDAVRRWIPELSAEVPPVTIRQLLTHQAGTRDWGDIVALGGWPRGTRDMRMADAVALIASQRALNFAPGAEYSYSNSNFVLAAEIVSRASGEEFATFTQRTIFDPLGMTRTSWRDSFRRPVSSRATAWTPNEAGAWELDMPFESVIGHAGLLTTVPDLLRWNSALDSDRIGARGLREQMERVGVLASGKATHYALGLDVDTLMGARIVSHAGATAGYRAYLARVPASQSMPATSVALLCNAGSLNTEELGPQLVALAAELAPAMGAGGAAAGPAVRAAAIGTAPSPWTPTNSELLAFSGDYGSADAGAAWRVFVEKDSLRIAVRPGLTRVLTPIAENRFTVNDEGWRVQFRREASGRTIGLSASTRRMRDMPFSVVASSSARALPAGVRLSAAAVKRDFAVLRRALVELHPGLYRYVTPEQFDSAFTSISQPLLAGATRAELFLAASRIAAAVRCGHTWTNPLNQGSNVLSELFGKADKLPLRLALAEGRFLVLASRVPTITAHSELLSIDGMTADRIVQDMLPYLRADGASDGKRLQQLTHGDEPSAMDHLFPVLHPPRDGGYTLVTRARDRRTLDTTRVLTTTTAERDSALSTAGFRPARRDWTLEIGGDTAVMTIPGFDVFGGAWDWKDWLRSSFATLRDKRTPVLLIDIRRNEGGDGQVVDTLLSYLLRAPFVAPANHAESVYERAPYALARYLDTWDFSFFDRTGDVTKTAGRNWLVNSRAARVDTVRPVASPYAGRAVLLVGPENSSAAFMLARRAKESGAALVLGQPTGGNYRGLNGGELGWVTLPNSGVAVDVPLLAWIPDSAQPDAPVTPDVLVPHRFGDAQRGIDADRRAVHAALQQRQRR